MTATEKLRAMLDERGVKWSGSNTRTTLWCGFEAVAVEESNGDLSLTCFTSPEQAIAATLGTGTCHEVMIDKFFRGCSECGYMWEYMYGIGNRSGPNFCPNCGRKVVVK